MYRASDEHPMSTQWENTEIPRKMQRNDKWKIIEKELWSKAIILH